jgi:hypothetical protein
VPGTPGKRRPLAGRCEESRNWRPELARGLGSGGTQGVCPSVAPRSPMG